LVKSTEHKDKLSIKQRPLNSVHHALRNSPEPCITLHCIASQFDRDIVQRGTVWRPELRRVHNERVSLVYRHFGVDLDNPRIWLVEDEIGGFGGVGVGVDGYID
jgi:hypothetical protein